jgi:L-2,4-diaminobutyric acid acetyltransferase
MSGTTYREITPIQTADGIVLRAPRAEDGPTVHRLIAACPPLSTNSLYCNLLQCSHFAATSAIASRGAEALGFVAGYRLPDAPRTLFVWQVASAPTAWPAG